MDELPQLAVAYVAERATRGRFRPRTVQTVTYTLRGFIPHCPADGHIEAEHVEAWLDATKMAPATARSRLSQVRGFCRWLIRRGHLDLDPTLDIEGPRPPRYVPRGLRSDAVGAALDACPDTRARLILMLMVEEGLRCAEVAALEVGDVDFDEQLMIVNGKGGHQRVLPLTDDTWGAIGEYLTEHPAYAGPLIRSYNNPYRGIDASYVSTLVARWIRSAGVEATAHRLRHTAASDMLKSGAHLRDVQAALGHVSLSTTQRYLPWTVGDLRTAMGGRHYGRAARPVDSASDLATPDFTPVTHA
jgi:site-specific recombinase XerD